MRRARATLLVVFLVSGAAGLIYEVLWTRWLALVFGVTTHAAATVLAAFMGGLALGSWALGRRVDRYRNPLLVYAALEVGIGLYGMLVPELFAALRAPYVWLRQLDLPYAGLALGRAALAGLVLLLPTTLMGGTFPALARAFVRTREDVGRGTGLLYFVNTAGAIAGCLLAGFVLIERFGLAGTTRVAAGLNLTVAAIAAGLGLALGRGGARAVDGEPTAFAVVTPRAARAALIAIGVSGFASLAAEVLWTRALLRYLYNSTYAFTTMLATFLAGIALGSWLYATVLRRTRRPLVLFAALEMLVGIGFIGSGLLFVDLMPASSAILGGARIGSFGESVLAMFVRAALILLLPTICLGATLPLATDVCVGPLAQLGHTVGRVYAVNTLGAIAGSVGAAFVLIPLLGMLGTLRFLIAVHFALALLLAVADPSFVRRRIFAGGLAAVLLAAVVGMPRDLFMRTFGPPRSRLVYYREGATDTVAVAERDGQRMIVYDDQRGTAATFTFPMNFFFGHLPMLVHPGEPRRALHICFGVGNSLSAMLAWDSLERIDSVELSPHVLDAAEYFWTNSDVLADPRVRTVIDDGRNFLLASRDTYDVIELEPPEIFTAGVINLYTREFYAEAAAHLAADGVVLQWVPVGEASLDEERMLFRAFADVFPHATAWVELDHGPILFLGTKAPLRIDYARLREKMQRPRVQRDLELIGLIDIDHLLSLFVFDETAFREFAADVAPVTDDRTVLDFSMPRYIGSGFGLGQFGGHLSLLARADGQAAVTVLADRISYYRDRRRSVVPYLVNLDGDAAQVAARITAPRPPAPAVRAIPREAWHRW